MVLIPWLLAQASSGGPFLLRNQGREFGEGGVDDVEG